MSNLKPDIKPEIGAVFLLASLNVLVNTWWLMHPMSNHMPLVTVNIIIALLLAGILIYVKRVK